MYPTDRAEFDAGRAALMQLPKGLADIGGVGETAYGDADEIRVFQSPWYIEIQVMFAGLTDTGPIVSLAHTALARLP
jgi:hypothetical protein